MYHSLNKHGDSDVVHHMLDKWRESLAQYRDVIFFYRVWLSMFFALDVPWVCSLLLKKVFLDEVKISIEMMRNEKTAPSTPLIYSSEDL